MLNSPKPRHAKNTMKNKRYSEEKTVSMSPASGFGFVPKSRLAIANSVRCFVVHETVTLGLVFYFINVTPLRDHAYVASSQ